MFLQSTFFSLSASFSLLKKNNNRETCKNLFLPFGFRLGGGKGATFFGRPESGFIRHQPPPPCHRSSTPTRSKSVRVLHVAGAAGWSIPSPRSPSGLPFLRNGCLFPHHIALKSCCLVQAFAVPRSGRCGAAAESLPFWASACPRVNGEGGPEDPWRLCSPHALG